MRVLRALSPALLWIPFAVWMYVAYQRDPYDPASTRRYGNNGEGAFEHHLVMSLVALVIVTALLQPWRRAPERILQAAAVLATFLWAFVRMLLLMHAGSVAGVHLLWCLALFGFAAVWYAAGAWRDHRAARKLSSASR
jgi:hypothetical protein